MWLIIGPHKAMLIDTAYGLGDMKGLVDEITGGMPLIVANTHVGPDHVLGNCSFDKVYCHTPKTASIPRRSSQSFRVAGRQKRMERTKAYFWRQIKMSGLDFLICSPIRMLIDLHFR